MGLVTSSPTGFGQARYRLPATFQHVLEFQQSEAAKPKGRLIHGVGLVPDIIVETPRPTVAKAQGGPGEKESEPGKERPEKRQEKKISEEEGDASLQISRREGPDPNSDIQLKRAMEILKASQILEKGFVKGSAG